MKVIFLCLLVLTAAFLVLQVQAGRCPVVTSHCPSCQTTCPIGQRLQRDPCNCCNNQCIPVGNWFVSILKVVLSGYFKFWFFFQKQFRSYFICIVKQLLDV